MQPDPVPRLIARCREELAAAFDFSREVRTRAAPAVLEVMGGSIEHAGGTSYHVPVNRAAAVALQEREDRQVQVFSFNLFDAHQPFTFMMSLDALASATADMLREGFRDPGRRWAGYLAGCLHVLQAEGLIDLKNSSIRGINIALLSTIRVGAGIGSSTAVTAATMANLVEHFRLRDKLDPPKIARLCEFVENRILGVRCGIAQLLSCCLSGSGEAGLTLPAGARIIGIDSGVWLDSDGSRIQQMRTAAAMAHALILKRMRDIGDAVGRPLQSDPIAGQLARLDPDDYKLHFRPLLPQKLQGDDFASTVGPIFEPIDPRATYFVQQAADHVVLESRRVRRFAEFLSTAGALPPGSPKRKDLLDKAGHLMYASHLSYTNDAQLGCHECDLLVNLVRARGHEGLYGAKLTGRGSGGTVAVLCDGSVRADAAIAAIGSEYEKLTSRSVAVVSNAPSAGDNSMLKTGTSIDGG